jgi:hypothetical protein
MSKVGNPIERGDVLLNSETTSGILNPHSILKVTSLNKKAIRAARIKPGNNPSEPILLIIAFFAANLLKGSENVVIIHTVIAINIDIG